MSSKFLIALITICLPFVSPFVGANESTESNKSKEIRAETMYYTSETLYHDDSLPTALLIMIDGPDWEIVSPPMVRRTPDSEEPLFAFRLEDWENPTPFAIDHIQWLLDQDLGDDREDSVFNFLKAHEDIVTQFPYVIVNRETGKYTFARPMSKANMVAFFTKYTNKRYQRGFENGLNKGYQEVSGTGVGSVLHDL